MIAMALPPAGGRFETAGVSAPVPFRKFLAFGKILMDERPC